MDAFVKSQLYDCGCEQYVKNFEGVGQNEFMKLTLRDILDRIWPGKMHGEADLEAVERILARKYQLLNSYGGPASGILAKFRFAQPEPHGRMDHHDEDGELDDGVSSTSSKLRDFENRSLAIDQQSNVSSDSAMSDRLVSEIRSFIREETQNFITEEQFTDTTKDLSNRINQNKASINRLEQFTRESTQSSRRPHVSTMSAQNQHRSTQSNPTMNTRYSWSSEMEFQANRSETRKGKRRPTSARYH